MNLCLKQEQKIIVFPLNEAHFDQFFTWKSWFTKSLDICIGKWDKNTEEERNFSIICFLQTSGESRCAITWKTGEEQHHKEEENGGGGAGDELMKI